MTAHIQLYATKRCVTRYSQRVGGDAPLALTVTCFDANATAPALAAGHRRSIPRRGKPDCWRDDACHGDGSPRCTRVCIQSIYSRVHCVATGRHAIQWRGKSRWSPPHTDTRHPRQATRTLLAYWKGTRYLIEGIVWIEMVKGNGHRNFR
ncbi:hypothetical protein EVAR_25121_1 [Eumeta japonica]|uniref:Uncharacterized protein n=1 Tax=Eumeta variegata TaxID=151549 RepID=A0A4C1XLI1_EUMVA|nr:hypothetical protein EVAR_25121_1 [Eumeta japonica]